MIKNSDLRPLYDMNVIDFFNPKEPITSKIIEMIFNYYNESEFIVLKSFCKTFLNPLGFDVRDISEPIIISEKQGHIDVRISESEKYAIIIENKLKGAEFQRNQLARYIQILRNEGFEDEQIYVIILPRYKKININKSVWRLPPDVAKTTNYNRHCGTYDDKLCWCDIFSREYTPKEIKYCSSCRLLEESFAARTKILHIDFYEWLLGVENLIPKREINVRSAIVQFADYLNGLYNNRINQKLDMKIVDFLRDKLEVDVTKSSWKKLNDQIDEVQELIDGLTTLRTQISSDFIDKWYEQLLPKWSMLRNEPHKSFGILIKGMWFGCWWAEEADNHDSPIWGIFCDEGNPTSAKIKIAEKILSKCGLTNSVGDNQWMTWSNTIEGDKIADRLYTAAKDLGYLKI